MTRGFTLIEILVVMSITVIMTGILISNFSRTRVDLNQTRLLVQDAIREAQSMALAGSLYAGTSGVTGTYRCGYGIHFEQGAYRIYAGPDAESVNCSALNRNYEGGDETVRVAQLSNSQVEIVLPNGSAVPDIFFEPPNPTTYINNSSAPGVSVDITVRLKGAECPADCRIIHVTTSGLITTQ